MAALPEQDTDQQQFPAPLEFLTKDAIHPDNQALMDHEQQRWRLLGWWARLRLRRFVRSLMRELQRGGYNQLLKQHYKLWLEYRRARDAYRSTTFISDEAKREAQQRIIEIVTEGRQLKAAIDELKPSYELYVHYQGWLEYEEQNRRELQAEAKREKRIRKEMREEAKSLESIIRDVWKKTDHCHYTHKDSESKKEKTQVPKFDRSVITPAAHYFYLSASKRTLFGWRWKLPNGVTIGRLTDEEVIKNLHAATKRQVDAIWSDTGQLIFRVSRLDSPDAIPHLVNWRDAMHFFPEDRADKLPYTIGVKEDRKFQWFELGEGHPHVLIAGRSTSGKSNLMNGIIATLVATHTPKELRVLMIDMKGGIEMTHWADLPHMLWEMVKSVDQVQPVLQRLVAVMRRRMTLLEAVKAKTFPAYNAHVDSDHQLERVLVCFDELNTFVGLGAQTEEIHNLIMLLVSQGRAVGIHVIAATQYPEVKVIPGRIKSNMSVRLSGSMPTVTASQIILDNPEAARIADIPGRFVAVVGLKTLQVQCPFISDEEIAGVVSSTRLKYPDVANELSDMATQPALTIWNEQRVLKAALEWLDGQLSGDKLNKLLGSEESPGERHLKRMCRRLIDEFNSFGYVTLLEDGSKWKIKKIKRGYWLQAQSDQPNNKATSEIVETASD